MKKTLTVNLGGTVYHIDDDAYRLLDNYLSNLKHYFRKQESAEEIINDIEMRIAELFAEKVAAGKQVVTVQDVEEVIARVGKPEDFGIPKMMPSPINEQSNHLLPVRHIHELPVHVVCFVTRTVSCWGA